jgi:hypothetical protein
MIESETDINMVKDIREGRLISITDLVKLCEDQNRLLSEEDRQIGRFITQLSEYEQELYEKDAYIKKLEHKLKQNMKTSQHGEEVI